MSLTAPHRFVSLLREQRKKFCEQISALEKKNIWSQKKPILNEAALHFVHDVSAVEPRFLKNDMEGYGIEMQPHVIPTLHA